MQPIAQPLPWQELLRHAAKVKGYRQLALEVGYSPASIHLAAHGQYPGRTNRIQAAVERMRPQLEALLQKEAQQ